MFILLLFIVTCHLGHILLLFLILVIFLICISYNINFEDHTLFAKETMTDNKVKVREDGSSRKQTNNFPVKYNEEIIYINKDMRNMCIIILSLAVYIVFIHRVSVSML